MTYLFISLPFLIIGIIAFVLRFRNTRRYTAITLVVALILIVLTIIFDNLMVWAGFFGFGETRNLGLYIGLIPIEDLFYPLFAVLLIPALWLPMQKPQGLKDEEKVDEYAARHFFLL